MKTITVNAIKPYNILINDGLVNLCGKYIRNVSNAKKAVIITDSKVNALYSQGVKLSLEKNGFETSVFVFIEGEKSKNLNTIEQIYSFLVKNSVTRSDLVVALGGGVVGDIAGFAASTFLRGIDFVQIPTTLLSQLDSSIGGKTGVNLPEGKNLVGSFYQPKLVLVDSKTLLSLPKKDMCDGMAEAIKYGCIKSYELFKLINSNDALDNIEKIIYECIDIKRKIVEEDEFEKENRMLLNFGHTIGHALEKIYNYEKFSHGQAVAIGMAMVVKCGELRGLTNKGCYEKLLESLNRYSLLSSDNTSLERIMEACKTDKKNIDGILNIILLKDIGNGFIYKMNICDFYDFLKGEDK